MEKNIDMCGFSKKRVGLHKKASLAIFVVYLAITTSVDLFHSENCVFNNRHTSKTDGIFSNESCPACTFSADHNSTRASQGPVLLNVERLFISQFLPHSEVVHCDEWACSFAPRAPPIDYHFLRQQLECQYSASAAIPSFRDARFII